MNIDANKADVRRALEAAEARIVELEAELTGESISASRFPIMFRRYQRLLADLEEHAEQIREYADWLVDRDARLAAVIALCDGGGRIGWLDVADVQAAATGHIK